MRRVKMLAAWSETSNTIGDMCGFPDAVAARLVARKLAIYIDDDGNPIEQGGKKAAKAIEAAPVDKMVDPDSALNKAQARGRRKRKPAKPIGDEE